jgi:5-methylcytosine-specific restriction endonuclease McrA
MSSFQDLTGQKFGKLTVARRLEKHKAQTYWLCVCECGKNKSVQAGHLKNGSVRSCGCFKTPKYEDVAGQKFGLLTAVRRESYARAGTIWLCKCECGNTTTVPIFRLKNGNTKSCGCLISKVLSERSRGKVLRQDLTGRKFGLLTVFDLAKRVTRQRRKPGCAVDIYWSCFCECGNTKAVLASHLKRGLIQSCGCLKAKKVADLLSTRTDKRCTRCKQHKSLSEFGISRGRWDGLDPSCKPCRAIVSAINEHRRRNAPGSFNANDIKRMYEHQNGKCVYCSIDLSGGYHIDHIWPISRGGTNYPENLQLLCPQCNLRKGAKLPEVFLSDFRAK